MQQMTMLENMDLWITGVPVLLGAVGLSEEARRGAAHRVFVR